jgi:para-nitrobenzyl esterase
VTGRAGASAELGIRYARAPRFGAPEVLPWAGSSLGAFGPPAPQPERPISRFAHGPIPAADEDCLFLNVWTPPGSGPFPVLVWAIGGGWTIGWPGSPIYDGAALAAAAEAVVVTFAYRLGSLGWLAAPQPNLGLLDHVAALDWVREHIAAFGGNPGRVTMGGQSAGAANVADLLACPAAEGLFTRAILHSPPLPEACNDPERGARWARDLAARVSPDAPADAIVAAHEALLATGEWRGTRGAAWPTRDPETLPFAPLERVARPEIPVLVGTTRDEATFLLRTGGREAPDELVERVTRELFTDPTQRWARERAAAGGRVHLFRIDHGSPDPRLGALHTVDVPLLFGTYATEVGGHYLADDEDTRRVSAWMQHEWGRFIHGEGPSWQLTTVSSTVYSLAP